MISQSELIINNDGSIYHLGLKPDEVAGTVITVGDPDRVEMVVQEFDDIRIKRQNREFKSVTGRIGSKELTVISTGIGTDNIDIVLNELDALVNIDFEKREIKPSHTQLKIIRLGTTGGISDKVALGELIASKVALGFDSLFNFYGDIRQFEWTGSEIARNYFHKKFCYAFEAHTLLQKQFENKFKPVITATLPGFYGPQGRAIRLYGNSQEWLNQLRSFKAEGEGIVNIEMETAGIYGLSRLLSHQAISLSVVLANRVDGSFINNPLKAVHKLVQEALYVIERH